MLAGAVPISLNQNECVCTSHLSPLNRCARQIPRGAMLYCEHLSTWGSQGGLTCSLSSPLHCTLQSTHIETLAINGRPLTSLLPATLYPFTLSLSRSLNLTMLQVRSYSIRLPSRSRSADVRLTTRHALQLINIC